MDQDKAAAMAAAMAQAAQEQVTRSMTSIWVLCVLPAAFLGLRMYCKISAAGKRGLLIDDYVLIIAWIILLVDTIMRSFVLNIYNGIAHAMGPPDPASPELIRMSLLSAVAGVLSISSNMLSKTSFVFTLLRIATSRGLKIFLWFAIITMNMITVILLAVLLAQCNPVQRAWDKTLPGTCWDGKTVAIFFIFASAYSAAWDFVLSFLPWKLIWGLQMRMREKVGICVAMSMGIFAGVTAIVKCFYIARISYGDSSPFTDLFIWESAEISVTIIAATIPVLRVLVKKVNSRYKSTRVTTRGADVSLAALDRTANGRNISKQNSDIEADANSSKGILRIDEFEVSSASQSSRNGEKPDYDSKLR